MTWRLLACVCLMLLSFAAKGQTRFDYSLEWHQGKVVFHSGDSIECKLRYNTSLPDHVLQVLENENVISLSVDDVKAFSYFDNERNRKRSFATLLVTEGQFEGRKYFAELIYSNSRYQILRHKAIGIPYEHMRFTRFLRKPAVMTQRYIRDQDTQQLLSLSKENLLEIIGENRAEVSRFIQENHIRFKSIRDYKAVLDHCKLL